MRRAQAAADNWTKVLTRQPWKRWVSMKIQITLKWLTRAVSENPWLDGWCDWHTLARTMFRDWTVFLRTGGADKTFKFGNLSIRHGDREKISSAWQLFGNYLVSIGVRRIFTARNFATEIFNTLFPWLVH